MGSWRETLPTRRFFFFNDTATTEIYTLSLHDALPICGGDCPLAARTCASRGRFPGVGDRKSTRLNSSHLGISYAVFCLKKKKCSRVGARGGSTRGGSPGGHEWRGTG